MENEIFLPVLHSLENNNVFTGSYGKLRFKLTPNVVMKNAKEVDMEQSSVKAEYWHSDVCYELCQVESERTFPMSEQGREALRTWLWENR